LNSTGFRLSCTVRVEKADSAALFGSLRIYLERFGEVYDELDRQKKELLRESEKGNKAQAETMGVHSLLKVGRLYFILGRALGSERRRRDWRRGVPWRTWRMRRLPKWVVWQLSGLPERQRCLRSTRNSCVVWSASTIGH